MTLRIFISYRTSDGRDKATALARELGALFGDEQVFIDKDDLRAGAAWRHEVTQAIGAQPVLLLLVTPDLLGARDAAGALRIAAVDDPVRRELAAALDAGAQVVPLLGDGVDALPDAATLPPPFDRLGERTWRRLRAYDWPADVQRIAADLRAQGIAPKQVAAPSARARRWLLLAVAGGLLAVGAALWSSRRPAAPPPAQPPAPPPGLTGDWELSGSGNAPFVLSLRREGSAVAMQSRPLSILSRTDWDDYRSFWRERHGEALGDIVWRGEGLVEDPPGAASVADIAVSVVDAKGGEKIDGGNLHFSLAADGARATGTLWLNSEQRERAVELRRIR